MELLQAENGFFLVAAKVSFTRRALSPLTAGRLTLRLIHFIVLLSKSTAEIQPLSRGKTFEAAATVESHCEKSSPVNHLEASSTEHHQADELMTARKEKSISIKLPQLLNPSLYFNHPLFLEWKCDCMSVEAGQFVFNMGGRLLCRISDHHYTPKNNKIIIIITIMNYIRLVRVILLLERLSEVLLSGSPNTARGPRTAISQAAQCNH